MPEIWVTDIAQIEVADDCVRAVLTSGRKRIVLRGSRHTLVKALGMGTLALADVREAEVVELPPH